MSLFNSMFVKCVLLNKSKDFHWFEYINKIENIMLLSCPLSVQVFSAASSDALRQFA